MYPFLFSLSYTLLLGFYTSVSLRSKLRVGATYFFGSGTAGLYGVYGVGSGFGFSGFYQLLLYPL